MGIINAPTPAIAKPALLLAGAFVVAFLAERLF
jgi:hypothetical protein